ncbi:protein phosphatase 2C domain-containing protein [Dactylosporangium sp. NPDC006015]|uniref:protein phosphatase 2C domain-containing protein n=1 Tax=Dactylosporangium sp. NPDC006015 TaxID=3154576 RepID=UPI0033B60A75
MSMQILTRLRHGISSVLRGQGTATGATGASEPDDRDTARQDGTRQDGTRRDMHQGEARRGWREHARSAQRGGRERAGGRVTGPDGADDGPPAPVPPPIDREFERRYPSPGHDHRDGRPPAERGRNGTDQAPPPPRQGRPEPVQDPAAGGPAHSDLVPAHAVPPRFAPVSRASQMAWLLPQEPASPPGVAADQARVGDLRIRAASVVGAGHRCERPAKPRQDAYRVAQDATGDHLIIAVADGMSDSSRAELGASVAVGTAVGLLRRELDQGVPPDRLSVERIFAEVAGNIAAAARERGLDPAHVRTTLALAVLPTRSTGVRRIAWAGQLADTHLWMLRRQRWQCLTGEAKEQFDGSVLSAFLPHYPQAARAILFDLNEAVAVALLSDGVADAFSQVDGAEHWFADRWRDPPPLASFMLDVDFQAKGLLDDRTAVVVWPHAPGGPEAARP